MNKAAYLQLLGKETPFSLRRAVERLRTGLFDPLAVQLLTVHEQKLNKLIDQGLNHSKNGAPPHLCICGSYGQGKSHSLLYIRERALKENFVTSLVNLDLREMPLHGLRQVYGALIRDIRFPGTDKALASLWRKWAKGQMANSNNNHQNGTASLLPPEIPHPFRSILTAIAQKNISLSNRQKRFKKYALFHPKEIPSILERGLAGDVIPMVRLRNALKYRQVSFYKDAPLSYKGTYIFIQMMQGLAKLFRQMGFKGWAVFFDEGESITQVRISARAQSYQILDQLFTPKKTDYGLYPVFAFTDDFFRCLEQEDFERMRRRKGQEIPYFPKNYLNLWRNLTLYRLQDLSDKEWDELAEKLLYLYIRAYKWQTEENGMLQKMRQRTAALKGEETRYILKALVEQLDVAAF